MARDIEKLLKDGFVIHKISDESLSLEIHHQPVVIVLIFRCCGFSEIELFARAMADMSTTYVVVSVKGGREGREGVFGLT